MKPTINRREWLRNIALLTGGLTFLPGLINKVSANHFNNNYQPYYDDKDFVFENEDAFPKLRARLFANENPFGPSEAAKRAITGAMNESFRYPFIELMGVEKKIVDFEGLGQKNILTGAGSSPLLRAASVHYSKPGSNIVTADPTYDDLPSHCEGFHAQLIKVPLTAAFEYDLDAIEKAINTNTSLVYICNPNNPTGTILNADKLRSFCDRVSKKVPVFVDEAYIDYLPDPKASSMVDCVKRGSNVIVARTFSKLYGFAGLRFGYVLAQPEVITQLDMYTPGGQSISALSVAAANVAFKEQPYLQDALSKTNTSKEYLYKILKEEGYTYIPSHTNFVMFPIKMEGQKFMDEMMKRGVGVRFWKFNNKEWCRVSVGRMDEMQAFAEAFIEIS
jgi:histidinol-phosphate aminotransferase